MPADLGTGLFYHVKTVEAITNLIGADNDCRFYPVATLSVKPLPLAVYEETPDDGYSAQDQAPSSASSRVVVSCLGVDIMAAKGLAAAFRAAWENFRGAMGP